MYVCECVVSKFLVKMDKYSNTHVFMGAYKSLLSYMYYCPRGGLHAVCPAAVADGKVW